MVRETQSQKTARIRRFKKAISKKLGKKFKKKISQVSEITGRSKRKSSRSQRRKEQELAKKEAAIKFIKSLQKTPQQIFKEQQAAKKKKEGKFKPQFAPTSKLQEQQRRQDKARRDQIGRKKQIAAEQIKTQIELRSPRTGRVTKGTKKTIDTSKKARLQSAEQLISDIQKPLREKAVSITKKKKVRQQIKTLEKLAGKPTFKPKKFSQLPKRTQDLLKGKTVIPIDKKAELESKRQVELEKKQLNLLKNAPKEVFLGVYEVGRNIVKSGVGALTGSFSYGQNLVKRSVAAGGGKRPIDFLVNDIKKIGTSTIAVTKFVKNNPKKAIFIVGVAAATIGASLTTEFIRNPIKTTTKAILILAPGTVFKAAKGGIQALSRVKKVQSVLHSQKFSSNTFKVTTDLVKGVAKVKGSTKGTFLNGKKFTTQYRLTVNTKLKDTVISGQLVTKVGKKTFTEKIRLIDKGSYYLDKKNKIRIPKIRAPIKSRSLTIKETKFTPRPGTQRNIISKEGSVSSIRGDFITTVTRIIDKTKKVTVRKGELVAGTLTKGQVTRIKNLSKQLSKTIGKKKRTTLQKPLTAKEIKDLERFIDTIGIKNISGLDRRLKIAKALGISKTSPSVKAIENIIGKSGRVKSVIIRKAKVVVKGKIKALPKKPVVKFKFKTRKLSSLKSNKKGQLSLVKNDRIQILKKTRTKIKTPKFIEIPALQSNIPLTVGRLKGLLVFTRTVAVLGKLATLERLINQIKKPSQQDVLKRTNDIKRDIKKINDIIKKNERISIIKQQRTQKRIQTILTKPLTGKGGTIKKTPPKTPPTPTLRPTPSTKPPKKPKILRLTFDSKLKKGERLKFDYKFRQGGKVRIARVGLPLNKALARATNAVDNTTQRSLELVISGVTKAKDITKPSRVKKFGIKKGKVALRLVEKSKFAIDKRGEKTGLKLSKLLKSTIKKKKKVVKKKTIKRNTKKKRK